MIESSVQHLIDQVIDSPVKLHLILVFHEHSRLEASAAQIAERTCRDIWSVTTALNELAEDGMLQCVTAFGGAPLYHYAPAYERVEAINQFFRLYDDPLTRDVIQRAIRESADYAPFRRVGGYAFAAA
jgi:hypothetical protein